MINIVKLPDSLPKNEWGLLEIFKHINNSIFQQNWHEEQHGVAAKDSLQKIPREEYNGVNAMPHVFLWRACQTGVLASALLPANPSSPASFVTKAAKHRSHEHVARSRQKLFQNPVYKIIPDNNYYGFFKDITHTFVIPYPSIL